MRRTTDAEPIAAIADGKICALLDRTEVRDLYDAGNLLDLEVCDERLRVVVAVYVAARPTGLDLEAERSVTVTPAEIDRRLRPMLRATPESSHSLARTLSDSRSRLLRRVLPLPAGHGEFVERVNTHGEVRAHLLTDDRDLQRRIIRHPHLRWKAQNVREFRRRSGEPPS